LAVQPSRHYAWLKETLSRPAHERARQTELIRQAWKDSGKVYGYRKLHDELLDQGETFCPNRVARLARLAGIKAQMGYKRRPGHDGHGPRQTVKVTPTVRSKTMLSTPSIGSTIAALKRRAPRHRLTEQGRNHGRGLITRYGLSADRSDGERLFDRAAVRNLFAGGG